MHEYTDIQTQTAPYGYDPCDTNGFISYITNIDWIGVSILCCGAAWVTYQYHQPIPSRLYYVVQPILRAVAAVAHRLAIDIARFLLTILGIVAELLLEASYLLPALLRGSRSRINQIVDTLRPPLRTTSRFCDRCWHSHLANLTWQYLRAFRELLNNTLFWGVMISILWVCLHLNSDDKQNDNADLDVRRYVVPSWVIKARPENRPRDGSSSHYMSEDDFAHLLDSHTHESHLISAISIALKRPFADRAYHEQTLSV